MKTVDAIFEIETVRSPVLLDLSAAPQLDMHSVQMLVSVADELAAASIRFQAVEAHASVRERLRADGLEARLGGIDQVTTVRTSWRIFVSNPKIKNQPAADEPTSGRQFWKSMVGLECHAA